MWLACCVMFDSLTDSSAIASGTCICDIVVLMWQLVSPRIVNACVNSSFVPGRPAVVHENGVLKFAAQPEATCYLVALS